MRLDRLWPREEDQAAGRVVKFAGGILGGQTVALLWVATAPSTVPYGTRPGILALSLVAAVLFRTIRDWEPSRGDSWWQPRWRLWVVGVMPPVINLGVWVTFLLRVREVSDSDRPTGRWKLLAVGGAVVSAVGTAYVQASGGVGTTRTLPTLVGMAALVSVGFTLVAIFYDVRYVTERFEGTAHGWLFKGYHWIVLVGFLIPSNLVFALLYLLRRRMLLNRAEGSHGAMGDLSGKESFSGEADPDEPAHNEESSDPHD